MFGFFAVLAIGLEFVFFPWQKKQTLSLLEHWNAATRKIFRLKEIELIEAQNSNLSPLVPKERIEQALNLSLNVPIQNIDLVSLERKIKLIPWVDEVEIRRTLTGKITFTYTMHEIAAMTLREKQPWLISAKGKFVAPFRTYIQWAQSRKPQVQEDGVVLSAVSKSAPIILDVPMILGTTGFKNALKVMASFQERMQPYVTAIDQLDVLSPRFVHMLVHVKYDEFTSKVWIKADPQLQEHQLKQLKDVLRYVVKKRIVVSSMDIRPSKKIIVSTPKGTYNF